MKINVTETFYLPQNLGDIFLRFFRIYVLYESKCLVEYNTQTFI